MYNELSKPGGCLSYPEHTGLIMNTTDGIAVFLNSPNTLPLACLSVTYKFTPRIENAKRLPSSCRCLAWTS